MADYSSGAIYFTGLGSGTDFDDIITATIDAESYRLESWEEKEETYELQVEYLQELNSAVSSLSTALDSMDSVSDFLVTEATSTSTSLGVSAGSEATEGTHTVTVNQLAQTDIWVNTATGESAADSVITTSNASFTYSYGGEEHTIDVEAGTTLEDLADLITDFDETEGDVRASVVYDGSDYYLKIYGMDQGADYTISVSSSTTLAGYGDGDFENTQTAQNAQLKVDGYPPGADDWLERETNSITDVIDGVTLTLYDTCEDAKVNVTLDSESITENIESLVEAINTVYSYIDLMTSVDDDGEGSVFTCNYGVRLAEQLLKQATSSQAAGFDYYDSDTGLGDIFSALSQIGISTDADEDSETFGMLVIDDDETGRGPGRGRRVRGHALRRRRRGRGPSPRTSPSSRPSRVSPRVATTRWSTRCPAGPSSGPPWTARKPSSRGLEITAANDTAGAGLTVRVGQRHRRQLLGRGLHQAGHRGRPVRGGHQPHQQRRRPVPDHGGQLQRPTGRSGRPHRGRAGPPGRLGVLPARALCRAGGHPGRVRRYLRSVGQHPGRSRFIVRRGGAVLWSPARAGLFCVLAVREPAPTRKPPDTMSRGPITGFFAEFREWRKRFFVCGKRVLKAAATRLYY